MDASEKKQIKIYEALMAGKYEEVIQLCRGVPNGGLHNITIHRSTVLHMAAYTKNNQLLIDLLNLVPEDHYPDLKCENNSGNTILNEVAKFDTLVEAAKEMLKKAPALFDIPNKRGEMPLIRAARYGKSRMFEFLEDHANKVVGNDQEKLKKYLVREDKTNILHAAILTEHFELARKIAQKYSWLTSEKDRDGMTALQLLACNPSAFKSGNTLNFIEEIIYPYVSVEGDSESQKDNTNFRWPIGDKIRKMKKRNESAEKLAMLLIESDMTWKLTGSGEGRNLPKIHAYVSAPQDQNIQNRKKDGADKKKSSPPIPQTPLLLATKSGCMEIVKGILEKYPQAISHVDSRGRNILHVAIKYRQIQIFEIVEKKKISMKKLREKHDNDGNSILHMVGKKAKEHVHKDKRSPSLILQEDLLLFERIEKISPTHQTKHINSKGNTAKNLLTESNAQLHSDAKEWMKRAAENCSIVAVLIATVAFAAAYTVPGGPNDKGYPILENNSFFTLFTIADVLSLGFALTAVIIFLSILTSPFRLKDFKRYLPQKLMLGVTMLILAVCMMMLAFAATVILLIRNKEKWTTISLYLVAFFPVTVFGITYFPLYMSLMDTIKSSTEKICSFIPRFGIHDMFFFKSQASVDENHSHLDTICCLA